MKILCTVRQDLSCYVFYFSLPFDRVLHKQRFSRLTSDLHHSLLQLIGLRNVVNTFKVKIAKSKDQKKQGKHMKPVHSALGYQSSLKLLLASISIMLNIVV